jgi:acyl-CoA synthetase (NDP forming)
LMRQSGAIQARSLEELLDTLAAFHFLRGHSDLRVGYVCAGGGNSVAAGDASYRAGLVLPHLTAKTHDAIASFLPPVGTSASNPVDMLAPFPSAPELRGVLEAMAGSGEVGAIVLDKIIMSVELRRLLHYAEQSPAEDEPWLTEIPVDIQRTYGLPVVVVLRENLDPEGACAFDDERLRLRRYYQANGIAVYPTADRAFRALGHVIGHNSRRATDRGEA